MTERVVLLLSHASVLEALQSDDVLETLNDISPLSDHYIPTLQFLMRPDNLVALVFSLLEEPPKDVTQRQKAAHEAQEPTYDEYAIVFRAHWVLCSSGFSSQLISALLALQPQAQSSAPALASVPYQSLCERLVSYYSRDPMNLEALTRFLNLFMDQYSPEVFLTFLGPTFELRFMQTLLVLVHYEPIRDVLLRIYNEVPDSFASLRGLMTQMLCQLAPGRCCCGYLEDEFLAKCVREDPQHVQFSRMIFTCDLLTDLIHERRQGSLGFYFIHQLNHDETHISHLLDAALRDLEALPTQMANESYVIKVLNSLLQQVQCGCVSKIAFSAAFARQTELTGDPAVDDSLLSPHVDLPPLWKRFIVRLPELLGFLHIPPKRRYRTSHIQMIYLMLPLLNVSCCAVDRELIKHETMEQLLDLIIRFPQANILHCAISRLYIVALEDSPFMFGKELPAFRAANDPLRLHMLLKGCFETVVRVYEQHESDTSVSPPPPAFVDIAISFDQAVTNAHAHSPHLFSRSIMERWHAFRSRVLLPTQTKWEEQQGQPAPSSPHKGFIDGELYDASDAPMVLPIPDGIPVASSPQQLYPSKSDGETSASIASAVKAEEIPTPLSALYNEEEKSLMLHVAGSTASTGDTATDPAASVMPPGLPLS